jgi:hypothetical protein
MDDSPLDEADADACHTSALWRFNKCWVSCAMLPDVFFFLHVDAEENCAMARYEAWKRILQNPFTSN